MTTRCIRIIIFIFALGWFSGARSDLRAQQIWELANKTHRSTEIIPGDKKVIFSVSNHLFFSSDLGHSLTVDGGSATGGITGFAIGSTGTYYFSSPQGLYSSPAYTDMNNENWVRIDSSVIPNITSLFVRASGKNGTDDIFAGTASGLWRRKPSNKIWGKIHDAGDGAPILQIAASNSNIYYRTAQTAYASHDGGATWKSISTSVTNATITAIVTTSDNDVYLALSGSPGSHILHSVDGGNTFNGSRGIDFSSRTIKTLVVNSQGDLFLGGGVRDPNNLDSITQGFVFRFLHDASAWDDFSPGLPSGTPAPEVIGMGFGSNGNVFAGTDSAGLWRTLLPSAVRQNTSLTGITLSQNFPNPANVFTEFSVFTEHSINASLSVFDALGRNVMQLSDGELTPGIHYFTIGTKSLPNGTYFYRLQTPEIIESRPFVVSK